MLRKNEVKYIQSLYDKKTRDREELFVAEGPKLVDELLKSEYLIEKIYAVDEWIAVHTELQNVEEINKDELKKISNQHTPNQVLAIARQKKNDALPVLENKITLLLDDIQNPGNFGTIIRIADWFGVEQIIASDATADVYNPKVIQSSMGSFLRVDIWYGDIINFLQHASVPVYGAVLQGKSLKQTGIIKEGLLAIGNEARGIRDSAMHYIQHTIAIPRIGNAESLNAAVAAGIILSHIIDLPSL